MIKFAFLASRLSLALSLFLAKLPPTAGDDGTEEMSKLIALDFEVFGIVQGINSPFYWHTHNLYSRHARLVSAH